ncbi:MAG: regulatory protein RecX [Solirubrobacterales bacterium]|nr:regulatory protein RecX [Solirubrobacterales bacterium]
MAADALQIAYAYINRRERTEAEVRSRLEKAECPESESEAAVAELLELGYVDDARYARLFTEDKRNLEGWGSERIARALSERGVARSLVSAALAETDGPSEAERAGELLAQRFPVPSDDPRERDRAFGFLARKGYESEVAADAVRAWRKR